MPLPDWQKRLRPASYRGVPFKVDSAEWDAGRRAAVHEFPQRDEPQVEDLGRSADRFRVTGFVVGDDFVDQADRLVDACRKPSQFAPRRTGGVLSHPYLGILDVHCLTCNARYSTGHGRMATVSMEFVEVGAGGLPRITLDEIGQVDDAAADLDTAGSALVVADLAVDGVPESVREATEAETLSLSAKLAELTAVFTGPADDIAAFADKVTQLIGQVSTLATAPANLVASITGAIDGILAAAGNALGSLEAYKTLFGFSPTLEDGTSASATAANKNANLVADLIRQSAAAGAVRSAARVSWLSLDDAIAERDKLLAEIDALLSCTDDATCEAIADLRRSLVAAVPPPGEDLPRLENVTLPDTLPAIVLAYRLYDDPSRDAEIVARNNVARPGFLPPAQPLQVLVNG